MWVRGYASTAENQEHVIFIRTVNENVRRPAKSIQPVDIYRHKHTHAHKTRNNTKSEKDESEEKNICFVYQSVIPIIMLNMLLLWAHSMYLFGRLNRLYAYVMCLFNVLPKLSTTLSETSVEFLDVLFFA